MKKTKVKFALPKRLIISMNSCQSDPQEREITDIKKEETLLNLMKIL